MRNVVQYAYFDHTVPDPKPVLGWYDTAVTQASALPAADDLLPLTPAQWTQHMADLRLSSFTIQAGALVYAVVPPPAPTLAQQAQAALLAGVSVTSTSTPALNGTYNIDVPAQAKIAATSAYILRNGTFYKGQATLPWVDASGTPHVFPSTTIFEDFATKIGDYVYELDMIIASGAGTLPSPSVIIA